MSGYASSSLVATIYMCVYMQLYVCVCVPMAVLINPDASARYWMCLRRNVLQLIPPNMLLLEASDYTSLMGCIIHWTTHSYFCTSLLLHTIARGSSLPLDEGCEGYH